MPPFRFFTLRKPGADQQLQGARRAGARFAEQHDLLGAVQLGQAPRQLPQRDQRGVFQVRDLQLVRLAHIHQAQVVALLSGARQLAGALISQPAPPSLLRGRARARRRRLRSRSARSLRGWVRTPCSWGSSCSLTNSKDISRALYSISLPISGSPMPRISLSASVACRVPMVPGSTPSTPPSAQEGTSPGGGGSGNRQR
jgi:hypothetical protein